MTAQFRTPSRAMVEKSAMDDIYRYQRYIYDVTRRFYLFGRNECLHDMAPPTRGSVVEIGCGTARNLIVAAKMYPDAMFYGFDISSEMLKSAEKSVAASAAAKRITLTQGDATTFDTDAMFAVSKPDRMFASYVLSMIPEWQLVLRQAAKQIPEGGSLHIVDFGDMQGLPRNARLAMHTWLKRFSVTPRHDLFAEAIQVADDLRLTVRCHHGRYHYSAHVVLTRQSA